MAKFDRKIKICQFMQPYDRNIPYNDLPALPPSAECYRDEELYTLLTSHEHTFSITSVAAFKYFVSPVILYAYAK